MNDESKNTDQIFMEELKREFMETVTRNLADLKRLFEESRNRVEEIAKISHDIKGTSGIFGLDEGTEIARELNIAAKNNELGKIKDLIDKLETYMKEQDILIEENAG